MSESKLTASETFDSVTGFDEMSITQHFGRPIGELLDEDPSMWARALVFVDKRRAGVNDDDARNASLSLSLKAVSTYFAEESAESGKDEPAGEPQLEPSPIGASAPDEAVTSI